MNKAKSFKQFLSINWWFLLLGFSKVLINSEKSQMTNSKIIDLFIFTSFLLVLMFIYWVIKYKIFLPK